MGRIRNDALLAAEAGQGADRLGPQQAQEAAEAAREVVAIEPPDGAPVQVQRRFAQICEAITAQGRLLPEHAASIHLAAVALAEVDEAHAMVEKRGRWIERGVRTQPSGAAKHLLQALKTADALLAKLMLTRLHSRMLAPLRAAGTADDDPFADL